MIFKPVYSRAAQDGYVLLSVMLAITIIAALALLGSHQSAMNVNLAASDYDITRANYVAQAGLQHTQHHIEEVGCGVYSDITDQPFGSDSYSSIITTNSVGATITTYTVPVSDDTFIKLSTPDQAYGNTGQLEVYYNLIPYEILRALYRFDVESAGIPATAQVLSATARFYMIEENELAPITIHQITADWTEDDASWNSINDQHDPVPAAAIPITLLAGVTTDINMTSLVQGWVNGSIVNQGVMLKTTFPLDLTQLASKEYGTSAFHPVLEIEVLEGDIADKASISVSGTLANGVTQSIQRNNATLYQTPSTSSTLQPAGGIEDTYLSKNNEEDNFGASTTLKLDKNNKDNILLRFRTEVLPPTAKIEQATLELYLSSALSINNGSINVHKVTRGWIEGDKDGEEAEDEGEGATYESYDGDHDWNNNGGDYDDEVVDSLSVDSITPGWYSFDVTEAIVAWHEGEANYGFLLKGQAGTLDNLLFISSDDVDNPEFHPRLNLTFKCVCGIVCTLPQGSGNVLMVVDNDNNPDESDIKKQAFIESWGYTVSLIEADDSQSDFDDAIENNDVVYVSESIDSAELGSKLVSTEKGIVNEEADQNIILGLAINGTHGAQASADIVDYSHYITSLFSGGVKPLYTNQMEMLYASSIPVGDVQTLLEINSGGGLLALEKDGNSYNGLTQVAGRRAMVFSGRASDNKMNWDYLNNNGRLLIQRSIEWALSADADEEPEKALLMVVVDPDSLTVQEQLKKTLFESWNYEVNLIDASASQSEFDAAVAENEVVFIGEDIYSGNVNTKLNGATIGIVSEENALSDELGFASSYSSQTSSDILVIDNSHYITEPFTPGIVSIADSSIGLMVKEGTLAPDSQVLANVSIAAGLVALESGAEAYDSSFVAGRRVMLPWGPDSFDLNTLNDNGKTILQRSLEWVSMPPSEEESPTRILFVVADPANLTTSESNKKTLMESWGFDVNLMDDSESQSSFDAAFTVNDVIYTSEVNQYGDFGTKLVNASIGLVNEEGGSIDDYGFGGSFAFGNGYQMTIVDNSHYITETVSAGTLNLYSSSDQTVGISGSTAPDGELLGSTGSRPLLLAIESGGSLAGGGTAAGRRVHVPWGKSDFADGDITDDGKTLMRRSIEWAAGLGSSGSDDSGDGDSGGGGVFVCNGNYRDEFNAEAYDGNDGSLTWSGDWIEFNDSGGPGSDDEQVMDDPEDLVSPGSLQVRIRDNDGGGEGIVREFDLTGASSATISFKYRRRSLDSSSDYVALQFSSNGSSGPWTEITRFRGSANDSIYQDYSFNQDISAFGYTNSAIRFISSANLGWNDHVWFDDIDITCSP